MHATYSPDDNKLRLYTDKRLDTDDYQRARNAGFRWAPRQELFVGPKWTPQGEDLLIEWCGEIGDEDTTLADRAEVRADRFEDYSSKRLDDANAAKAGVDQIADGIPLGQPILVGHHSEKHARKHAEKIENGMRKALKMWETSEYWTRRASSALSHAKYLERPDVRARRIKKITADLNRCVAEYTPKDPNATNMQVPWHCPTCGESLCDDHDRKVKVLHVLVGQGRAKHWVRASTLGNTKRRYARWVAHYQNRIAYEKVMLGEQGALALLDKKKRPKQLPICNYRASAGLQIENLYHKGEFSTYPQEEMTKAEYSKTYSENKGTRTIDGTHRVKVIIDMQRHVVVFLTDSKVHQVPAAKPEEPLKPTPLPEITPAFKAQWAGRSKRPDRLEFDDMKDALKAGVQVVSAPQLFPTPPALVEQMIGLADLKVPSEDHPQMTILEPSAGTGRILDALEGYAVTAYEISRELWVPLQEKYESSNIHVYREDFLEVISPIDEYCKYDRIIMNPPFTRGADIKHIKHALSFLKPRGILVAICSDGPRQKTQLEPLTDYWEPLPEGSFKNQGTNVRTVLLTIRG